MTPAGALRLETAKQARRPRNAGIIAGAALVEAGVCALIIATSRHAPQRIGDWGSVIPGSTGLTVALVALNAMTLLAFPVAASVFAADSIAGEAGFGSLRYLAARPVSRWRILASKAALAAALTVATIVVSFVVATVIGVAAFGWHPLVVIDLQHSDAFHLAAAQFGPGSALLRSAGAFGVVLASTAAVFAFSLLLSTMTDQAVAAAAGGIGFAFASRALDNIPGLGSLSPWMPVSEGGTTAWSGLFDAPAHTGAIQHLLIVQAIYVAAFLTAAAVRFARSDIG